MCVLLQGFGSNLRETQRQVALSDAWYRPQLDLARWIEDEVPEETPLLVDNIPACWLNRRVHPRRLVSWFDAPVPSDDEAAFSQWVSDEGFGWVLCEMFRPVLAHQRMQSVAVTRRLLYE